MNKLTVIVVDDSALMRKIISDMINEENDMEVISIARNGEELIEKLKTLNPDVVTLDVEMPKMDGVTALKKLRESKKDVKVIMLSSLTSSSSNLTLECLELGAADFVQKPSGSISLDINKVKEELVAKIRVVSQIKKPMILSDKRTLISKKYTNSLSDVSSIKSTRHTIGKRFDAVVIGASTGGPKALYNVITELPGDLGVPVFVVQHMPKGFTKAFADRLNNNSKLKVVEAVHNQIIEKNTVYVAPGGYHMEVSGDGKIKLNEEPAIWGVRPAVDKLFISASKVYKGNLLSVVLTGMGRDGADGTSVVKLGGGYTISEDESTCTIYGMPKAAYATGKVDEVLPLYDICRKITQLVGK